MLAQNFKSAVDLGLTEKEQSALIKVLGMLERGELVHDMHFKCDAPNGFNMAHERFEASCGTVACVAGWCDIVGDTDFVEGPWPGRTTELFAPKNLPQRCWSEITPAQAAIALRNYLTTGRPGWVAAF